MPLVANLVKQIAGLNPEEQEEFLLALNESVLSSTPIVLSRFKSDPTQDFSLIVETQDVCGGAPRLVRTRIPVWTLERMRQLGISQVDILRSFPSLREADLVQAWSYAAHHRNEIEKAILENEEG